MTEKDTQPGADRVAPDGAGSGDRALSVLEVYVASSKGTPAASRVAEAALYERELITALASVNEVGIQIFRNATSDFGADAIVEVDGRRLLLVIKIAGSRVNTRGLFTQSVVRLRRALENDDPIIVVSPSPAGLSEEAEQTYRARAVQWRDSADTPALVVALRESATMWH
ncbi:MULTISPECIES: hypothetical protein [unclassified Microbacterium]|uniref:hypothetical protein n=1 Tax=unclassified Microbacterium TaxID=2609290 RepID=UPI0011B0CF0D|nr:MULTISPECIES: hypothetical protein [unclassified Microbacterium]